MFRQLRRAKRIMQINFVLARHGLDKLIFTLHLFGPLRYLIYLNPYNWFRPQEYSRGAAIRHALEDLGPIFVKFGQALSIRRDLLPNDIVAELALLQDQVPPYSGAEACAAIEKALGKPLNELFNEIDPEPLASASIAQVHAAKLFDGCDVVVKVRRPNISKQIERDIDLMYTVARWAERYWDDAKRYHPIEVVAEFEKTIIDELDFKREAANASQLRRNFAGNPDLYVPEIYWPYTRENILVMERIYGIPITDMHRLREHNVNIKKLAEQGVKIFFTQVFEHNFFHADMHPGNIFVSFKNPENPQYISVDFGIMGSMSESDKRYIAENFYAFFERDYRRVAELHIESGWTPANIRVDEFESAIRTVSEPIFEQPLSQISFAQSLLYLLQIGRRFEMQVQPQLMLLQKTLFAIEGLGRQLYPDLDLWKTAKPFIEKWIRSQMGVRALLRKTKHYAPMWAEMLPELPNLTYRALTYVDELRKADLFVESDKLARGRRPWVKRKFSWGSFATGLGVASLVAAGLVWFGGIQMLHVATPQMLGLSLAVVSIVLFGFALLKK